ncbi:MAG: hypothetical protein PVI01_08430 [Gemmatimonadales bacterium]|jgi:hypothetical protein
MRYPLAGRDALSALATGGGLFTSGLALTRAVAKRAIGPLAVPLAVGGGLMWLGRNIGDAFVELREEDLRIKLGVLFDEVIPLREISRVREMEWSLLGGLGIRSNLRNWVAVVTTTGPVAEIFLWRPIRLPVIPRVYHVRAQKVMVSPERLEDFIRELRARLQT